VRTAQPGSVQRTKRANDAALLGKPAQQANPVEDDEASQ
jgi:hypothetical protein